MCEVFLCFIEHLNIQKLSDITKAIPMFFKGIAYFFWGIITNDFRNNHNAHNTAEADYRHNWTF